MKHVVLKMIQIYANHLNVKTTDAVGEILKDGCYGKCFAEAFLLQWFYICIVSVTLFVSYIVLLFLPVSQNNLNWSWWTLVTVLRFIIISCVNSLNDGVIRTSFRFRLVYLLSGSFVSLLILELMSCWNRSQSKKTWWRLHRFLPSRGKRITNCMLRTGRRCRGNLL